MAGTRGLSLIEVVIVMAILALSLGLVGPQIGAGLSRLELQSANRTIQNFVKIAQMEAQRSERGHYIVFDKRRHSVVLVRQDLEVLREESLPSSVQFLFEPSTDVVAVYVGPSGLLRANRVRLRGRSGEAEVPLQ